MRFDLDTEIRYPDGGRAGVLRRVIMDEAGQVYHVAMATDSLVSRMVLVPVGALSEAPGNVLALNVTQEQLDGLPDYEEERVPMVPDGWQFPNDAAPGFDVFPGTILEPIIPIIEVSNVPDAMSIGQGTEVWCLDGRWGTVDEALTGDDGHLYAFLGRSDEADEHSRLVPMELVQEVNGNQLTLNCTLADISTYTQEIESEDKEPEL